jgi:rhodanese-related sulfurtransferase
MKNINAETLQNWLDNNEVVIVDVREPAEHEAERISGAILLPLASVSKNTLPKFDKKKLVIHCRSGKRSHNACDRLLQEDPNLEIYNLEGGISAWSNSGCKIIKSGKFFLPLDRQVQLTIGLGVVLGSVLGYFLNPIFFLFSGFFGAGLCFAGLTGYCGLAVLMAKMPWNKGSKYNFCSTKK